MITSDSSPLIVFGRLGSLGLLRSCFQTVAIPGAVYSEVACRPNSPEAIALQEAIHTGWVVRQATPAAKLLLQANLGKGEVEALSLAKKLGTMLLIDDENAKTYAALLGIEAHGSIYVLFLACKKGIIAKKQAKALLDSMVQTGFYISTNVYVRFVSLLETL